MKKQLAAIAAPLSPPALPGMVVAPTSTTSGVAAVPNPYSTAPAGRGRGPVVGPIVQMFADVAGVQFPHPLEGAALFPHSGPLSPKCFRNALGAEPSAGRVRPAVSLTFRR
jgi:hypothetical protein